MKFLLVFILSLIVLCETIIPCCVWDSCAQETTTTSNSKKDKGECSPFTASCSSCTSGVILAKVTTPEFSITIPLVKHIAAYQSMRATPYTRSLLQPPRLA
ncbi:MULTISPECIES: hypothetical protein [unclassified Chitinophaga]|uniref:hypothetical protein n=1 Tax=unclassified Chitinophaga TaxID=2619133 RepID=UPI00117E4F71|nr:MULTISPECIES: hypothetical protein [unclassified Chitinophaga]WPV64005.1 hypothetical protein QQL36_19580 [Chitinophaga sp. LS1]